MCVCVSVRVFVCVFHLVELDTVGVIHHLHDADLVLDILKKCLCR